MRGDVGKLLQLLVVVLQCRIYFSQLFIGSRQFFIHRRKFLCAFLHLKLQCQLRFPLAGYIAGRAAKRSRRTRGIVEYPCLCMNGTHLAGDTVDDGMLVLVNAIRPRLNNSGDGVRHGLTVLRRQGIISCVHVLGIVRKTQPAHEPG